jgi:hypothetical protein
MPNLLGGLTPDERRAADERREIERTARHYPHLDIPSRAPRTDYSGSERCSSGGRHNFAYQGYSDSIGHYYRCTKCGNRN